MMHTFIFHNELSQFSCKNEVYHTNHGVIQGFPALRKAVTTHMWKIFSLLFDIANQLLTHHSPFAPRSGWRINGEAFTILNPPSFIGIFFGLRLLKHWKIRIAYRQRRSNFPKRERKTKERKINRKLRIQWLSWWHFSRLRTEIDIGKVCHKQILAIYLTDFFCR